MAKAKQIYICTRCGFESPKWMGQCPSCHEWNCLEEREVPAKTAGPSAVASIVKKSAGDGLKPLKKVSLVGNERILTRISELDRVLGGGIVKDSISIIAAKPGAGKSTLLMQIAQKVAEQGLTVLYVSGEESESQMRRRAERILESEIHEGLWVLSTAEMNEVLSAIDQVDPVLVILDSIQTFFLDEFSSRPGSPTQIIECTNAVLRIAKDPARPRAVIMAGQMTKEDELAGVRSLEHMVDTVLFMEADPVEEIRTLSASKNRFGSTGEMGFFTMEENGLFPIENPSRFFMTKRSPDTVVNGSCLSVIKEGTRPMIIEIESLISQSFTPYPSRISECLSRDRLGTLISILEQRSGITLFDKNVVVKSTGGLKLSQPSVSLAVLVCLASSSLRKPVTPNTVFLGDVGLTGELKKVPSIDLMIREAARLGFSAVYVPAGEYKAETRKSLGNTKLIPMKDLSSVIRHVFGDYSRGFQSSRSAEE